MHSQLDYYIYSVLKDGGPNYGEERWTGGLHSVRYKIYINVSSQDLTRNENSLVPSWLCTLSICEAQQ